MHPKKKPTTIRRDDPEVNDQPGTFTLVNQAEAILKKMVEGEIFLPED